MPILSSPQLSPKAGWNHLQQAGALANYYQRMRTGEGWSDERLLPVLAGALELLPWLLQWHNELDPNFGMGLGSFYRTFVDEEMRHMGKTAAEIKAWTPPVVAVSGQWRGGRCCPRTTDHGQSLGCRGLQG